MRIRFHRLLLTVGITAVTAWSLMPSVLVTPSIDAVVNAEVVVINSATEGLMVDGPPAVGTSLFQGQTVGRVENHRQDRSFLGELRTEHASLTERTAALSRQESALMRTASLLADRIGTHRSFELARLDNAIDEASASIAAMDARLEAARLDHGRTRKLVSDGTVTRARHDDARLLEAELKSERQAATARLRVLETRRSAVRASTFLTDGQNDVPYSQQRLDEVNLRLEDLRARRSEYRIRIAQIDTESGRLEVNRQTTYAAPVDGVVWKRFIKPGTEVVIGTEMLEMVDCRSAFLDVSLEEEMFPDLTVGQDVSIRFVGETTRHTTRIRSIRGAGAVTEDRLLAARTQPRGQREFQVILDFDMTKAGATAENFCLIGRSAEVAFTNDSVDGVLEQIAALFESRPAVAGEAQ
ncbi:MAG: HlyD family secretion protein [Alphaproteobacteria bacterium]|nr:HlyD family secretion protein [Alphaproteobacteria bacterium]